MTHVNLRIKSGTIDSKVTEVWDLTENKKMMKEIINDERNEDNDLHKKIKLKVLLKLK